MAAAAPPPTAAPAPGIPWVARDAAFNASVARRAYAIALPYAQRHRELARVGGDPTVRRALADMDRPLAQRRGNAPDRTTDGLTLALLNQIQRALWVWPHVVDHQGVIWVQLNMPGHRMDVARALAQRGFVLGAQNSVGFRVRPPSPRSAAVLSSS